MKSLNVFICSKKNMKMISKTNNKPSTIKKTIEKNKQKWISNRRKHQTDPMFSKRETEKEKKRSKTGMISNICA